MAPIKPGYGSSRSRGGIEAEDIALALALVITAILGLTMLSLVVLEFLEILPGGFERIAFLSLVVFCAVIGRALMARVLSTPSVYRGHTPVIRQPR